jgi:hypothetical protein
MNKAKAALGAVLAIEGFGALSRFNKRKRSFASAALRAKVLKRKLVVVGSPDTGLHTRLLRAYGCGDVCVDLVGCGECPDSISADITRGPVPGIADNSAVVFVSCVFEYVSDPFSAWREVVRMAGSPENVFMVSVQPWTITSALYPGAHWAVYGEPPVSAGLEVSPVRPHVKLAYASVLGALSYFAFRRTPT